MSGGWRGSDRRQRLPDDWPKRRRRILKRDGYRCTHRDDYGDRCVEPATDVDHIRPGDNHADSNLASLCGYHHRKKSSGEGGAARAIARRVNARKFSRVEDHPGLL